jgi:phenylacetate 2-hydroxylase
MPPQATHRLQEVLRYWSTLNLSFARESVKDISYKGARIATGTPFLMAGVFDP